MKCVIWQSKNIDMEFFRIWIWAFDEMLFILLGAITFIDISK